MVRPRLNAAAPRRRQPARPPQIASLIRWSQAKKDSAYRRVLCKALLHDKPVDIHRLFLLECGHSTMMPMFSHISLKKPQTVPRYRKGDCVMLFYPSANSDCQMTFAVKVKQGKSGYKALDKLKERIDFNKLCQQVKFYKRQKAFEQRLNERNNNNNNNNNNNVAVLPVENDDQEEEDYDAVEERVQAHQGVVAEEEVLPRRRRRLRERGRRQDLPENATRPRADEEALDLQQEGRNVKPNNTPGAVVIDVDDDDDSVNNI